MTSIRYLENGKASERRADSLLFCRKSKAKFYCSFLASTLVGRKPPLRCARQLRTAEFVRRLGRFTQVQLETDKKMTTG